MNFDEILREKIARSTAETTPASRPQSLDGQGIEPAHLAFLIGRIGRHEGLARGKYRVPQRPPPPPKPHALTERQREAMDFFRAHGFSLGESFSRPELKAAFRRAALKMHPDRGGLASDFVQLREHYKALSSLWTPGDASL